MQIFVYVEVEHSMIQIKDFDPSKPIDPGIYKGISIHDYHRGHLKGIISKSYLVKHADCPAAVIEPDTDSDDKRMGRAMHPFILEGEEVFNSEFAVVPDFPCPKGRSAAGWKNTNDYKRMFELWEMEIGGREVVKRDQFETIQRMKSGVHGNPVAKVFIDSGMPELTMIWQDTDVVMPDGTVIKGTGLWCKSRPDITLITESGVDFADLKKTQTIKKHAFQQAIYKYGYHIQAAMAFEGLWRIAGIKADAFTFIAITDKPPYQCEIHPITIARWIDRGIKQFHKYLLFEKTCREAGYWPNHELVFEPSQPIDLHAVNADEIDIPGYLTDEKIPWEMMGNEVVK